MNRRELGRIVGGAALTAASYSRIYGANDRLGMALLPGSGRRGREVMTAFLKTGQATCAPSATSTTSSANGRWTPSPKSRLTTRADPVRRAGGSAGSSRRRRPADRSARPPSCDPRLHHARGRANTLTLEKPTTHRFSEQHRLLKAVQSSGKVLQCGTQQRSGAHYKQAKEEIFDKGKLGKIAIVRAAWSNFPWQTRHIVPAPKPDNLDWERFLGPAPQRPYDTYRYDSWRCFHDYGNGLLADILTHWADVAQWMMGETEPASAVTLGGIYELNDGRDNPDTVNSVLQYKGGWNLTFESSVLPLNDMNGRV